MQKRTAIMVVIALPIVVYVASYVILRRAIAGKSQHDPIETVHFRYVYGDWSQWVRYITYERNEYIFRTETSSPGFHTRQHSRGQKRSILPSVFMPLEYAESYVRFYTGMYSDNYRDHLRETQPQ